MEGLVGVNYRAEENAPCNTDVRSLHHLLFLSMTRVSFVSSFADAISDETFLLSLGQGHNFFAQFFVKYMSTKNVILY